MPLKLWNGTKSDTIQLSWKVLHLSKLSMWTINLSKWMIVTWFLSWYSWLAVARFPLSKLLDSTIGVFSKWKMFYWGWFSTLYTKLFWLLWPPITSGLFVTFFCNSIVCAFKIFYKRSISDYPTPGCLECPIPPLIIFIVNRFDCNKEEGAPPPPETV